MNHEIRVLMVDDEERFRETTRKILEGRGFEMILAASGPEALERISEDPDVVILDIKMPGMDGHETLNKIKELVPDLPVIMLTGHGALPSAQEALTRGAFDYLTKPCDIGLLSSKIRDAYARSRKNFLPEEKTVGGVMVPLAEYTVLRSDQTIREAIAALKDSFASKMATSRLMETGHRSILVTDTNGTLVGLMSIRDLLETIMPAYLTASKPATADSLQYSPMFWNGMFSHQVRQLGRKQIQTVMSSAPTTIDLNANLMEAAYTMLEKNTRRLAVLENEELVGIIREQDLFFEIEQILNK